MKDLYETYYKELIDWNEKYNLTAITDKDEVYLKHFKDSVLIKDHFSFGSSLLDIGSGAGFPAIPLKIERPDLSVIMIDSVNKKVNFLIHMIEELRLELINAYHVRIEDLKLRNFDYVTARAVAPLVTLAEYAIPFLKVGGEFIAYKSADIDEEIDAAQKAINFLGGKVENIICKNLTDDIVRKFVVIKKISPTPSGYPRSGNKPRLKPLCLKSNE